MSDEPRRSGRATKGQHKHTSPSPTPTQKPIKAVKSKRSKRSDDPGPTDEDDGDEEEIIRCVCGDPDPDDPRTFISCDACSVWQHSVCMGLPVDQDDMPDHYFCEECQPEEHQELVQALEHGEKIWETRNRIFESETKATRGRKGKAKQTDGKKPGWLRKDVIPSEDQPEKTTETGSEAESEGLRESSNKRKRSSNVEESLETTQPLEDGKSARIGRQDKRRKSSSTEVKNAVLDASTALVDLSALPADRQRIAQALSKILAEDIKERVQSGHILPRGQSVQEVADHHATRIEYALFMNHGGTKEQPYNQQFRALNANLKKNKVLIERLLNGSLSADELSTMSTSDMASEELQQERAVMKEALDRQVVAVVEEGPRYRQDHKGYQLIEHENQHLRNDNVLRSDPVKAQDSPSEDAKPVTATTGSPPQGDPQVSVSANETATSARRTSSQNFDMGNIWAKTAQSPTTGAPTGPRPPSASVRVPKSNTSITQGPTNGAQHDPDIDRLLDDNDDSYSPADASGRDAIVWRGKLAQSGDDNPPTVNARFVAGRDLSTTIPWQELFPPTLSINGRLQTSKAEEYLCGLRWSSSSDVSVLALTPYDNAEAFNNLFEYFIGRQRYAVVGNAKPALIKELYIIPVEVGADLPDHVDMLEHCAIKKPIEERLMLISMVVARAPDSPVVPENSASSQSATSRLPQHVRPSISAPAGSPLNPQLPFFSPATPTNISQASSATPNPMYQTAPPPAHNPSLPAAHSYGVTPAQSQEYGSFPPNPYSTQQAYTGPAPSQSLQPHPDPQVNKILGDLQFAPTAQEILRAGKQLNDVELGNLRRVLDHHPAARTDMATFARLLGT